MKSKYKNKPKGLDYFDCLKAIATIFGFENPFTSNTVAFAKRSGAADFAKKISKNQDWLIYGTSYADSTNSKTFLYKNIGNTIKTNVWGSPD